MGQPYAKLGSGAAVLAAVAAWVLMWAPPCFSGTALRGDFSLSDPSGEVTAMFVSAEGYTGERDAEVLEALSGGVPVIFHGAGSGRLLEIAEPAVAPMSLGGTTAVGVWRHRDGPVSVLVVRDANPAQAVPAPAISWAQEPPETPRGSQSEAVTLIGVLTELDIHMPAGAISTRTEVLRVEEDSPDADLYEFIVTQTLTPGAHTGESQWRWTRLEYSAVGGPGSGAELASYAPLPSEPHPRGLFTLLWRIMTFRWGGLIDWLLGGGGATWSDLSDEAAGLYAVAVEAGQGSEDASRPLEARHQYVFKAGAGDAPVVTILTRATFRKGGDGLEAYVTPPLGGPVTIRP